MTEAQQAAVGLRNSDWQHNHVPRVVALEAAGYPMLATKVSNYNQFAASKDACQLSGRSALAQDLGWALCPLRHGPASEAHEASLQILYAVWSCLLATHVSMSTASVQHTTFFCSHHYSLILIGALAEIVV